MYFTGFDRWLDDDDRDGSFDSQLADFLRRMLREDEGELPFAKSETAK